MQPNPNCLPNPDVFNDIAQFHEHFGLEYNGDARNLEPRLQAFREKFILEEFAEFSRAVSDEHAILQSAYLSFAEPEAPLIHEELTRAREQQLDAIVDMMYVLLGYAYLRGWYVPEAWRRVHEKNMLKQRVMPNDPRARSEWDVVKPAGWKAADLKDLVS